MGEPATGAAAVLVVGASSGLGQAIAAAAAAAGCRVAVAARRRALLAGDVVIGADVRDPDGCERMVADAVAGLAGLDAVVYAAGVSPLRRLADTGADTWREVFATNVVGAALVTRAALAHPGAGLRRAIYLSSRSASRPWPGLGAYSATKAALDALVPAWRAEHPSVAFCRVVVGDTVTAFADGWEPALLAELWGEWEAGGWAPSPSPMRPGDVAPAIVELITAADIPPPVVELFEPPRR